MSRLVVIGDALLDRDLDGRAERLAPDAPVPVRDGIEARDRAGGAGLAAAIAATDGHAVTLVCALGGDPAGARVRELLEGAGVAVLDLGLHGATPRAATTPSPSCPRPPRSPNGADGPWSCPTWPAVPPPS
jgi:bifunctional ADP-heptose synthase (sugar kinase/adenylyltransferase)